ncbi:Asp-tRNA(Asn)/Glu-tRNA(Gln) amidotransferase subunit GatC [Deinococcus sp. MIMF12]|uniref:Aspartyl/glutamyl-tRNA(Asn/Gln) amidotransferase subunit C n=1 Tax=Deinococcus rhizophilus TaxID=3049544 RepID=A0ABT7JMJ4_9DEIO|nr:Asp-tRNA(Asn)/Glu-tRNA(Gln) amidotransferase subunit GatC [Deinococcus rhizophilus]MDL2344884.1 Asp-tRNA(Asn)/Glu-tRNA(Gln) amidotransferase subunit GatC [Deinococcus rhizophilus]
MIDPVSSVPLDVREVEHLARLARLDLTPEEREALRGDLGRILGYFEQLRTVDTAGVEEMQRPVSLVNVLRDDVPGEVLAPEAVAALAPEMDGGFVRVPRTVEVD